MKLAQLLTSLQPLAPAVFPEELSAIGDRPIRGVFYRAQLVEPGGVFVAVKGFSADGHDYIAQAVSRGAVAVVCERPVAIDIPQICVTDSRKALAAVAAEFYGHPSRHMIVVGITGTNGKTTTSFLIESMLAAAGHPTGVIGTLNYRYAGRVFDNPVTTPESLDLQRIMADMHAAGTTHVVMEISSHALDLFRIHACDIDVAVFTNLSQDHLDFHMNMETYWASKRKLFDFFLPACKGKADVRAVINVDDPKGAELAAILAIAHLTTSQGQIADVRSLTAGFDLHGINARIHTPQGVVEVNSALTGRHNLENILNAVGVGAALDLRPAAMQSGIAALDNVPGRLERVADPAGQRFVYVDYAHTPDALEKALKALRDLTTKRIVCVFGCGGDRDHTKRPLMGAIAARLSDLAVVTSDNPRTEAPDRIIDQILTGLRAVRDDACTPKGLDNGSHPNGYLVEADRRTAIRLAVKACGPGDTLLIAGKGHEPYQIIGKQKLPFDDRIAAREALALINQDKTGTAGF